MRRLTWRVMMLAIIALVSTFVVVPVSAQPDLVPGLPVYLSLGDSWAWGQGPDDPATEGYVAQLHDALKAELDCLPARSPRARDGCKHLQLHNLARPAVGELQGVTAPIIVEEQLPIALPLLKGRNGDRNPRNDVEVITLHVGGNDVSGPIRDACTGDTPEDCIPTIVFEMAMFEIDLRAVVGPLRDAAAETPIVLGTYDNPIPFCNDGTDPDAIVLGALVLEGTPDGSIDGIHDVIRRVAADYENVAVAEVFGQLTSSDDWVGGADCLHPAAPGHDKVTESFVDLFTD